MASNQEMSQLREIIQMLDDRISKADEKNKIQKDTFVEYIRIFQKLAQKLALLSNKINENILSSQDPNEEAIGNIFQHFSNTLLRMADCSRNVALKAKNEVFDPLKLFSDNYSNLNNNLLKRIKTREAELHEKYEELHKNRDMYYQACEKLDKHKKGQSKAMAKIENGDLDELDKFNHTIKKVTENIKNNEEQYSRSVDFINMSLVDMRRELKEMATSLSYNEESRMSFCKKSLVSSIKILEDFTSFFDSGVEKKIQDSLKLLESQRSEEQVRKSLNVRIALLENSKFKESFISFQDLMRSKRKKSLEEENSHLNEIFNKVREDDKEIIRFIIFPWFMSEAEKKKLANSRKKFHERDIDQCKQKILCVQPYSFYFVEKVYEKVLDMNSFYLKLSDESFLLLLNMFQTITNNLELIENTNASVLGIEFLYKMIQVSLRIIWKKNYAANKGHPIELLCQHFGKKSKNLNNEIVLKKLYFYLQKKKALKKIVIAEESKGVMGALFKGFGAVMTRKKEPTLTDDENFSCLTEITQIMANLLTPSEVAIPFIKSLLGKNENSKSFEYLKSILLEKKDQQERQKIFFRTQIKGKKEEEIRKAYENKRLAEYSIMLTAKRGFFDRKDLGLRLVCSNIRNVHLEIIPRLGMEIEKKWIRLIPLKKELDYVDMKREVAENSVPSSIEQIITLDVNRSLHNHGEYLNPTILHSLLRTYAYFHKDISYCQGMNYIAGYLYIKTRDEEWAYRIFQYLMEIRFKELFANEFEVLKIKMYQFQRLLGIFHPEISDHFKKQSITPECYIVSWIITLFASSYQYTMESYLIDLLWERFIVWGWREFFRFVLSLFNFNKEELMELTYDKALHFLGEMGKSEMFLAGKEEYFENFPKNAVEEGIEQYPISEQLLKTLEKEYKLT